MAAPYVAGQSKYTGIAKPSANVIPMLQLLTTPGYLSPKALMLNKEIKGGLHHVDYLSQLTVTDLYDGIFLERREEGMGCIVKYNDDGTENFSLYVLKEMPGTSLDQWEKKGEKAGDGVGGNQQPITLNNAKTYATLAARDAAMTEPGIGTITSGAYTPGTNSTEVTGTGTAFTTQLAAGDYFRLTATSPVIKVISVTSDTVLVAEGEPAAFTDAAWLEVLVNPNDFANVVDARTPAEQDVAVSGTTIALTAGNLQATRSNTSALAVGDRFRVTVSGTTYTLTVNGLSGTTVFLLEPSPVTANAAAITIAGTGAYTQSFVWDGQAWLVVNSFNKDANSHPRNRDSQVMTLEGVAVTANAIKSHHDNTNIHHEIGDSDITTNASTGEVSGGTTSRVPSTAKLVELHALSIKKPTAPVTLTNKDKYLSYEGTYKDVPSAGATITSIDGGSPSSTY